MSTMMSDDFILEVPDVDSFKMWQGLVGPYFIPSVDGAGNLSWTNTGDLPNPDTVNVTGRGLTIVGVVEDESELPATANEYDVYLVGSDEEYYAFMFVDGEWVSIGLIGRGEKGDQGDPGVGVPASGTTGQVLAKRSGTNYDTYWVTPATVPSRATEDPLMDGTAAVGTSSKWAKEDHVHPTDTTRQEVLVSGTNIKTVDGESLLGSGNIDIIPPSGAAGKVLVKNSASDYDVTWGDAGGALYFTSVAVAAATGDIVTLSNSAITSDYVLANIVWANPAAITSGVIDWTTSSGSLVLNGSCSTATTAEIVLVLKNN